MPACGDRVALVLDDDEGVVTKIGSGWITVKLDDGTVEKFRSTELQWRKKLMDSLTPYLQAMVQDKDLTLKQELDMMAETGVSTSSAVEEQHLKSLEQPPAARETSREKRAADKWQTVVLPKSVDAEQLRREKNESSYISFCSRHKLSQKKELTLEEARAVYAKTMPWTGQRKFDDDGWFRFTVKMDLAERERVIGVGVSRQRILYPILYEDGDKEDLYWLNATSDMDSNANGLLESLDGSVLDRISQVIGVMVYQSDDGAQSSSSSSSSSSNVVNGSKSLKEQ